MDPKTKAEAAGLGAKIISFLMVVLPPVILANVTHWAASIITEKTLTRRARLAIFCGSFGLASVVHWICSLTNMGKWEWIFIWSSSMGTQQLLRFFYLEWGEILKVWVRAQLSQALKLFDKKPTSES